MLHQATEELTDEVSPVPEAKAACFISQDRVCGTDCMAYLQNPPKDKDYIGEQWARCHLLVNMHRGGKHLVVLAEVGSKLIAAKRQDEREKKAPGVG